MGVADVAGLLLARTRYAVSVVIFPGIHHAYELLNLILMTICK